MIPGGDLYSTEACSQVSKQCQLENVIPPGDIYMVISGLIVWKINAKRLTHRGQTGNAIRFTHLFNMYWAIGCGWLSDTICQPATVSVGPQVWNYSPHLALSHPWHYTLQHNGLPHSTSLPLSLSCRPYSYKIHLVCQTLTLWTKDTRLFSDVLCSGD